MTINTDVIRRSHCLRLVLTISVALLTSGSRALCQTYTWPENGHTYSVVAYGSWNSAENAAVALGGHLVTVNDAAEQSMLYNTFTGLSEFWIGFSDAASEGTWVWSSGEIATYTNWRSGEPNNTGGAEDWGVLVRWSGGKWNDFNLSLYGVAEIKCSESNSLYLQNAAVDSTKEFNQITAIYAGYQVDPDTGRAAGNYTVSATGDLSLFSETSVTLDEGFSVEDGGLFVADIVAEADCD